MGEPHAWLKLKSLKARFEIRVLSADKIVRLGITPKFEIIKMQVL